jgi:hypothetical protein
MVLLGFCKCEEVDCIFSISHYTQFLDSQFRNLWDL